jgi:spermidine synthase
LLTAAATNLAVGALAFFLGIQPKRPPHPAKLDKPTKANPFHRPSHAEASLHPRFPLAPLATIALSGYCAMAYEVIWTRLLGLVLGPTTYSFTLVLAIFILAMAIGAWIFGRLADRAGGPGWPLVFTQILAALLSLLSAQKMGTSQSFLGKVALTLGGDFGSTLFAKSIFLILILGGPVLLLGAAFPLATRLVMTSGLPGASAVGRTYAANTFGGVLGAVCAGFLLIPCLGKETSLSLLAGVQAVGALGLALALHAPAEPFVRHRQAWGVLSVLLIGTLAAATILPDWDRSGLARIAGDRPDPALAEKSWPSAFLQSRIPKNPMDFAREVFHGDGIGGFTSVWKTVNALGTEDFTLYNSGKADASSDLDRFTQVMLAHFPLALHPQPKQVMVLGLASGMTGGEVLRYPIDSLDILEINEQVVAASDFFKPWNNRVLTQPRTRLILQDAKAHLLLTPRTYDVIISEPSNPWMAGLAELFTLEFYQVARERLAKDGIMVQFIHSYQMDWPTFAMVGRTFAKAYPTSMLVRTLPDERASGEASDYLLVGFKSEAPPLLSAGPPRWDAPGQDPPLVHLENAQQLYRMVVAENLAELFGEGPLHTDDKPRLEYAAAKLMHTFDSRPIEAALQQGGRMTPWVGKLADSLRSDADARLDFAQFAFSLGRPFAGMVDTAVLTEAQRILFLGLVQNYCANQAVEDFTFLDGEDRRRCAAAQIAVLNRRLQKGAKGEEAASIRLAMGIVCRANGLPAKALEYFASVIGEAGEHSPLALAAFRETAFILKALGREQEADQAYRRSLAAP